MRSESSTANRYRRLARYLLRHRGAFAAIVVLTAISSLVVALQPWPIKILADYALGDAASVDIIERLEEMPFASAAGLLILLAGLASVLLFVARSAVDVGLTMLWSSTGQAMVYEFAADLFQRLTWLTLSFHRRCPVGDSLSRLSADTYSVFSIAQGLLVSPMRHVFTIAAVGALAWTMDPGLTLLALALAPLMAVLIVVFGDRLKSRGRLQREAQTQVMSLVQQTLSSIPVVQAFATQQRNRVAFEGLSSTAVEHSRRSGVITQGFTALNGLVMAVGSAIVIYVGGQRVLSGALSVGSLLVFVAYLQTLRGAAVGLMQVFAGLKVTEASMDRVFEVLDSEDTIFERRGSRPLRGLPRAVIGQVSLEGVTVGYSPGQPVLSEVTLQAHPGETVALVGATGAGKSTLVSLIPRFLDPWSGRVMVAGRDVRDVELGSLREHIGLVLQEPFLLPLSVAGNIAYGRPTASRAEIEAAARAAHADEFIRRLPEGYDTVLGERGATLSGGQSQRLAIARALLKDAPILILDEPTSALDAETERLLLSALRHLMAGRTTFIIAHRLSTIRDADRIVVLDEGRIVESGSHDELMRVNGHYARYTRLQLVAPDSRGAA